MATLAQRTANELPVEKQKYEQWIDLLPQTQSLEETLEWLQHEALTYPKTEQESVLEHMREMLGRLHRFLHEKNADSKMQTILKEANQLLTDMRLYKQQQPFRLSEDPRLKTVESLFHWASLLTRDLGAFMNSRETCAIQMHI